MDDHYNPSPEDDDESLVRHLANHNHQHANSQSSTSPTFSHTEYRHPSVPAIDPSLEGEGIPGPNGSNNNLDAQNTFSPTATHHNNSPLNPQQFPRQLYTDMARTALSPPTPTEPSSAITTRFPTAPQNHQKQLLPAYTPSDRSLPSRDVTDASIDNAYVAFILYCNPSVPLSTDTSELRRGFRAPPKSDGKSFNTFTLLELIRKLENKEIRTWTSLAIQLGVEPPMMAKNQSAQKVQQYAVRLKRWMHAMHVDAFFEYCLGKSHSYYTQVPPLSAPYPEFGRDGVPLEEDLALRALHPESRPKRGRRKTEDKDNDSEKGSSPAKRPHLDTSAATPSMDEFGGPHSALFPGSAIPSSAHPDDMDRYVDHLDPWAAASTITSGAVTASSGPQPSTPHAASGSGGQHFRWRLNARENTPSTPHPQSAMTPTISHPPDSIFDEPQSAITPTSSKVRSRRRHGPAVSSAWPSSGNPLTGKLRGRPPSNRSVRDGPFSTFPANPKTREGPVIDLGNTPVSTPISARGEGNHEMPQHFQFPPPPTSGGPSQQQGQGQGKPSGLHLQVPPRTGGNVQLATPTVVVNGEDSNPPFSPIPSKERNLKPPASFFDDPDGAGSGGGGGGSGGGGGGGSGGDEDFSSQHGGHPHGPSLADDIERTLAARLLNAGLSDGQPLSLEEAKVISEKTLQELRTNFAGSSGSGNEDTFLFNVSALLGVADSSGMAKVKNFKIERSPGPVGNGLSKGIASEGDDELGQQLGGVESVEADTINPGGQAGDGEAPGRHKTGGTSNYVYDISWQLQLSPLSCTFALHVAVPAIRGHHQHSAPNNTELPGQAASHFVGSIDRFDGNENGGVSTAGDLGDSFTEEDGETDWKKKFMALQKLVKEKEDEFGKLKRKVLEAILDKNI
ncbi:hypothetical protein GP486_005009 [Trichoglossum hirsutum]|uniref:ARS binding protein 2 n=1 Tax=Trichoglossum hirsutum TaxID=265104 RepID=A0A9P8LA24_9PEZI|nr:hypothetical protein GP486_005009 [Trichoglossum hirsutum]